MLTCYQITAYLTNEKVACYKINVNNSNFGQKKLSCKSHFVDIWFIMNIYFLILDWLQFYWIPTYVAFYRAADVLITHVAKYERQLSN